LQKSGKRWMNLEKEVAWLPGRECIWRQHGVWGFDRQGAPQLLCPSYFSQLQGRQVDFNQDYLLPFVQRFSKAIRAVDPGALIFFETEIEHPPPRLDLSQEQSYAYAPHWYDGLTLITKHFNRWLSYDTRNVRLVLGAGRIRKNFAEQLAGFKSDAIELFGGVPVLIGEIGIPIDLDRGRAYRSGDFAAQVKAMQRTLRAIDDNLLGSCIWNYTSDNSNARGDQWNGEDFSIFSRDQQADPRDPYSGGRALPALLRPYPLKIAGEPLQMTFDEKRKRFALAFRHDPRVSAPTEIFVPDYQFPHGFCVEVSDGSYELLADAQLVRYVCSPDRPVHSIEIRGLQAG